MAENITAITVTQLNRYIKDLFAGDINLRAVTLKGEVSNFTNHQKTGHFYFSLKDESASIRAIMFKGYASKVPFTVENGLNVVVRGSVQVFERDGAYQIYCETIEPDGVGALYLAYEQLKQRLYERGLFDPAHKKPLPAMPRRIGIVTAKTGAALQDILNILSRRYPIATAVVIPTLVQGENAPASIVEGIQHAEISGNIDLLIVGRGGGSIEDLWAFNDENVAQAIYDCPIPIISAVGHEIDYTIADFVADLRAPTPSAAAELAVPDIAQLSKTVESLRSALDFHTIAQLKKRYDRLKMAYQQLNRLSPAAKIGEAETDLTALTARLQLACENTLATHEHRWQRQIAMLEALSPLKVLTRGYSITYHEGEILRSTTGLKKGDELLTRLADGDVNSKII